MQKLDAIDSMTAYLLTLPSLVDKRHRRVWQVVRDRAAMATQLQSLLRDIGLERHRRVRRVTRGAVPFAEVNSGRRD